MTSPEVDQELERLFSVTREATQPDAGARARIRAGVDARLAAGGSVAPRATHQLWFGVGAAVIGLGAAALWFSTQPRGATPSAPAPLAATPPTPSASPPVLVAPPAPAPEPVAEPKPAPPQPVARPVPEASKPAQPSRPPSPSSVPAPPDATEELTLVRAMQQALRSGNASQALALAGEHARRFPRGSLIEEREGARAVARCQLAEPTARAAILESFTQRFGASPYAARVKAACQ